MKLLLRGAIFITTLGIIGAVYQSLATSRDRELYPPPGQLVDVGGYRLHVYCIGEGSPTVVLEAGSGGKGVIAWSLVQERMAITTRVCSYDRAGLGWSDPDPTDQPRPSLRVAQSLYTLLHNAGIDGPYVLVGHSSGGLHVRSFASQYPEEVVGMVLLGTRIEVKANAIALFDGAIADRAIRRRDALDIGNARFRQSLWIGDVAKPLALRIHEFMQERAGKRARDRIVTQHSK